MVGFGSLYSEEHKGMHHEKAGEKIEDSEHAGHEMGGKTETAIQGEVMDLFCYLSHPETGKGPSHAKCAKQCIEKGIPVGIRTREGVLYLAVSSDHSAANKMLAPHAGKMVTVEGSVKEHDGMKLIQIKKVSGS